MSRVAAIDLGTNSTRMLVADVEGQTIREIARRLTITRLGEGVDETGGLRPAARARVHACLSRYSRELERLGATKTLATATSWARDARDSDDLLAEVRERYGVETRNLSGEEEAELVFRGVASDRLVPEGTLLVDIGGGSTELALGGPTGVTFSVSVQAGCVRMTERHLRHDPPTPTELEACAADARSLLPALRVARGIGVAGTVTTLATLDLDLPDEDPDLVHGHVLTREAANRQLERLAALPLAERERVPGIPPGRAAVLVAGALVLREVLDAYLLSEIDVSEHDILHGAALAAAEI